MKKIIDLSQYNTVADWDAVKKNCDGVILRCGYRGNTEGKIKTDARFEKSVNECAKRKIPFGLYFMSQAITTAEGREEAEYTLKCAEKYGASMPLFIDSEDGDGTEKMVRADGLDKQTRTAICKAFCETVKKAGRKAGVYTSESWFNDNLNFLTLQQYIVWVAKYGANTGAPCTKVKLSKCDMWQYTSKGSVPGVKGRCDVSELYSESNMDGWLKKEKTEEEKEEEKKKGDGYMFDAPVLGGGMKGNAVLLWQKLLAGCGYDLGNDGRAGNLSGEFNEGTYIATLDYKKHVGISIGADGTDGTVTKETWATMLGI